MSRPKNKKVEKLLLARFKQMGILLIVMSACFFIYASILKASEIMEDGIVTTEEQTLSAGFEADGFLAEETLNFFVVSLLFATLGISCITVATKREKEEP